MRGYFRNYGEVEIKNCPFCGGYAKLEGKSKTIIKGELRYVTYVRCVVCDGRSRRVLMDCDDFEHGVVGARLEAVEAWNTRVEQ